MVNPSGFLSKMGSMQSVPAASRRCSSPTSVFAPVAMPAASPLLSSFPPIRSLLLASTSPLISTDSTALCATSEAGGRVTSIQHAL